MDKKPNNRLLASIWESDWDRIRHDFEAVELIQGKVLFEPGDRFTHVYFPEQGIVSSVATFETGAVVETAATGPEGMVSVGGALGGVTAVNRKVVQVPGSAYRMKLDAFERMQCAFPVFRQKLLAYVQAFLGQTLQSVACNGIHTVEERCARWLLMCHDRSEGNRFPLTQEFLAEMLGVSRPAVNRVCRMLQNAGAIRYSQGVIAIEDRKELEDAACECYSTIRHQFDRLLPGSFAR